MMDSSIFVRIFGDRIEIESPGLPLGLNMSDVTSGRSVIRNQVIAAVFKTIGFIERYGTGIHRMIVECEQSNIPRPEFTKNEEFFKVTFFRSGLKNARFETVYLTVDKKKDAILDILEDANVKYTQNEISETTGIPISDV